MVSGSAVRPVAGFGQIDESDSEQGDIDGESDTKRLFQEWLSN